MNESYLTVALIVLIVLILVHMVIYYIALTMNNKHLLRHPEYKSYVWGYFTGVVTIVWGIILFIVYLLLLFLNVDIGPINTTLFYLAFLIFYTALGYFVCSKEKWAFIILTILWINPIIWVINYFYIKRRPYLSKNYIQEESKEQEKSVKFNKSDENNDYIGQLEKAKKLLDDGALNTSEYEILKKQIMTKIQT